MYSRTDSCSREMWWCWLSLARLRMSVQASRRSARLTSGNTVTLDCSIVTCARRKSRPMTGSASGCAAPTLICSGARGLRRQLQAGLDIDKQRRHQQVLAGELEVVLADLVDVVEVLARDLRQRDVEDVEVLAPDQVQQQVQRGFEGLEEDLQRGRRDVQVRRHPEQRLAVQAGQRDAVDRRRAVGCIAEG